MTKQVNIRPELNKVTSKKNGNVEVLLIVSNNSLAGKFDDLSSYLGKTVTVIIAPESYEFKVPYNKQTGKPNIEYAVNPDGTVEVIKEEQTTLLDDGVNEIEEKTIQVDKDTIDQFIISAPSLELPNNISINPRNILSELEKGISIKEIAESNEMSEVAILNELEIARNHFAPFADTWKKNKIQFEEPVSEETSEEE